MKPILIATVLSALVKNAVAWGNLGHETVGFVAQQFLAPNALAFVQSSLSATDGGNLGNAATWADQVKHTSGFQWSAPLHFVDAQDSPTDGQCSVDETRDCSSDCILTAIANYTERVVDTTLDPEQQVEALKFLTHFFGDIGQPLHVEAFEVGGNNIPATCNGVQTNLHAAWDTGMVVQNINDNHGGTSQQYASDLIASIQTGDFQSQASSWINCSSTTQPLTKRGLLGLERRDITPLACPLVWATESNSFDCSAVFSFNTGDDLCATSYFTSAVPIIDLQLAKQGYRLAAWLNVLFDGSTNL